MISLSHAFKNMIFWLLLLSASFAVSGCTAKDRLALFSESFGNTTDRQILGVSIGDEAGKAAAILYAHGLHFYEEEPADELPPWLSPEAKILRRVVFGDRTPVLATRTLVVLYVDENRRVVGIAWHASLFPAI